MFDLILKFGLLLMAFFASISISLLQIGLGIATLGWLGIVISKRINLLKTPLFVPLCLFLLFSLLSIVFSVDPLYSLSKIKGLFSIVAFFIMATTLEKDFLKIFLFSWFGSTTIVASYGIWQGITNWGTRIAGFSQIQTLSAGLLLVILVELGILLFGKIKKWNKTILALSLILLIVALFFTYTRSIYIGLVVGIIILLISKGRKWALCSLSGLVILCLVSLLFLPQFEKVGLVKAIFPSLDSDSPRYSGDIKRIWSYTAAMKIIKTHPFTGVGIGCFRNVYPDYALNEQAKSYRPVRVSSDILQIGVESGLLGIASFLFLVIIFLKNGFSAFLKDRDPLKIGCLASFIGVMVSGLFEPRFCSPVVQILLYTLMGIVMIKGETTNK